VAIHTSVRAVLANPLTMATWGLIVAVALVLGSVPLFLGLAIVMPILAHATWHLYRKVVEPGLSPGLEYRAPRYAADFPAALFPTRPATGGQQDLGSTAPETSADQPARPIQEGSNPASS
jgi:hypothetical protein